MTEDIAKFVVNGHDVVVKMSTLENLPTSTRTFVGQKILHPMAVTIKQIEKIVTAKTKGRKPYTYNKHVTEVAYNSDFISPEAEDAIKNPSVVAVKFDGSCGFIQYDSKTDTHTMYTRIDLKFTADNKISMCGKQYGSESDLPSVMIPCEADPRNGTKYENYGKLHWPFMVPIAEAINETVKVLELVEGITVAKTYKWNIVAFENAVTSGKLSRLHRDITCEQMGKQFNLKERCDIMEKPALVPHNSMILDIPPELCTFTGFCEILKTISTIEGVVIYGKNGTVWKFRRDMIHISEEKLDWPPTTAQPTDWAQRVALL